MQQRDVTCLGGVGVQVVQLEAGSRVRDGRVVARCVPHGLPLPGPHRRGVDESGGWAAVDVLILRLGPFPVERGVRTLGGALLTRDPAAHADAVRVGRGRDAGDVGQRGEKVHRAPGAARDGVRVLAHHLRAPDDEGDPDAALVERVLAGAQAPVGVPQDVGEGAVGGRGVGVGARARPDEGVLVRGRPVVRGEDQQRVVGDAVLVQPGDDLSHVVVEQRDLRGVPLHVLGPGHLVVVGLGVGHLGGPVRELRREVDEELLLRVPVDEVQRRVLVDLRA